MDFPLKEKIPLKDYLWFKHTSFPHSYFEFLEAERVSVEPGHKMKFSVFLTRHSMAVFSLLLQP